MNDEIKDRLNILGLVEAWKKLLTERLIQLGILTPDERSEISEISSEDVFYIAFYLLPFQEAIQYLPIYYVKIYGFRYVLSFLDSIWDLPEYLSSYKAYMDSERQKLPRETRLEIESNFKNIPTGDNYGYRKVIDFLYSRNLNIDAITQREKELETLKLLFPLDKEMYKMAPSTAYQTIKRILDKHILENCLYDPQFYMSLINAEALNQATNELKYSVLNYYNTYPPQLYGTDISYQLTFLNTFYSQKDIIGKIYQEYMVYPIIKYILSSNETNIPQRLITYYNYFDDYGIKLNVMTSLIKYIEDTGYNFKSDRTLLQFFKENLPLFLESYYGAGEQYNKFLTTKGSKRELEPDIQHEGSEVDLEIQNKRRYVKAFHQKYLPQ